MRSSFMLAALGGAVLAASAQAQTDASPEARARVIVNRLEQGELEPDPAAMRLLELGDPAQAAVIDALPRLKKITDVRAMLFVLAERPTRAARDLMLKLSGDRRFEVRECVAQHLGQFAGDREVAAALLRLSNDADDRVVEAALGTFSKSAFDVWSPLLDMLVMELATSAPRANRTYPLTRALEGALARDPAPLDRVRELLQGCESLLEAGRSDELFGIVLRSRPAAVLPLMVALVVESCPAAPRPTDAGEPEADVIDAREVDGDPVVAELMAEGGPLEVLRPLSSDVVALAIEQLGKARHTPAFPAIHGAALDPRPPVRSAALAALIPCAPDEDVKLVAYRVLAETLGTGDRGLRSEAFTLLRRHTRQARIGLSQADWLVWIEKQEARRAVQKDLAAQAREAGLESVEELLRLYPELAPQEQTEDDHADSN